MISFFDYKICTDLPEVLPHKQLIINTINPHSFCIAEKDENFKEALIKSDILLPDGEGVVWGVKKLSGKKTRKIAGYDLHKHCLELLKKNGCGKVFYLGAAQNTLEKIQERLAVEYPMIEMEGYSPPYKPSFSQTENEEMIQRINAFQPDVLFVGMTAPKQEKWNEQHKNQIDAKIICAIGAVFDFYSGTIKRPSNFWINLKLEWFIRFLAEPKRLFERNFVSTPKFIFYILKSYRA